MIKLAQSRLIDILPPNLRSDPELKALCHAIDRQNEKLLAQSDLVLIWGAVIDSLPEAILDAMAIDLNVSWYDSAEPIAVKRDVIRSAAYIQLHLGTRGALEQVLADYFGGGVYTEWWQDEGSGQPGTFDAFVFDATATEARADLFREAIRRVKRLSAWLGRVVLELPAHQDTYVGIVVQEAEIQNIKVQGVS